MYKCFPKGGTVVDIAVKDVTSANSDSTSFLLHYQAVTDAEGTVPPPNSSIGLNNELFPLAAPPPLHGGNSRGAITNQVNYIVQRSVYTYTMLIRKRVPYHQNAIIIYTCI